MPVSAVAAKQLLGLVMAASTAGMQSPEKSRTNPVLLFVNVVSD
jgi:hypothetical protein